MKHVKLITEMYKEPKEYKKNSFGFNIPVTTYVDDVFDHVVDILCQVNGISEKSFNELDNTKKYVETYFDNNQEVLLEIDKNSDKRYQYTAELIYNEHFNNGDLKKLD